MGRLNELKKLHEKGMALIYLHPKQKRPLEMGWTTQTKKTWEELENSHEPSYNVGVRLGEPSFLVSGKYLGAIDCDVKSKSRKAHQEMNEALRALGIDLDTAPIVMSGRGNGSKHIYVQTEKPMRPMKYAQSIHQVKVLMVGEKKEHSKKECEVLTPREREEGYRLRAAWEISFMGTGQQTVLPPSIHPDTGFEYAWASPFKVKWLPEFKPETFVKQENGKKTATGEYGKFISEEVDLYQSRLALRWVKIIEEGVERGERSNVCLGAAMALCRAGFTDNQILSVMSDPNHGISEAASERRGNRDSAVQWLDRYALQPARHQTNVMRYFDNPPSKKERMSEEDARTLGDEFEEERSYYTKGERGALKPEYDALLKVFVKTHPYKMIADMKNVFVFNGTHYVDLTPYEIRAFVEKKLKPKPEEKQRQEFLHKVLANHVTRRNFFTDTIEGKINFKNGVLHVGGDGSLVSHTPNYGFRGVLPYNYDPDASCPFFKQWLSSIMFDDEDLISVLQEFMGYIVRGGDYKYHKALWLGGVGRNGKSTFVDLLKALIGVGNFSVISIKSLMTDKFAGADMDGKIANFSEETSPQELADSGPFKNLTGDGDLFAQKKFGDPYTYRNKAKLVMTYNQIPDLKDLSPGMLSRPIIIPFKKIIKESEQDRNIKKKLFKELPGIFNFALQGWERLEKQGGFTTSEQSALALQRVKEESCNVYQWAEHHVQPSKTSTTAHELFLAYARNERYAYKEVEFYRRLNAHPIIKNRKKRETCGNAYFVSLV
jgi:putative DNA primase/helicase